MIKPNYEIPAPIINDIGGSIEDVAGSLTTTRTLLNSLMGEVENMQLIAQQQKDRPGSISPDAVTGRLDDLWAMGDVLWQRLSDNITVLYAIVAKDNELTPQEIERASTAMPSPLLEQYRAASIELARASAQTDPAPSDDHIEALSAAATDAMWAYLEEYPATIDDMAGRYETMISEGLTVHPRAVDLLRRDFQHMAEIYAG